MYRLGITNRTVKKLRIYRKITYHDKIVSKTTLRQIRINATLKTTLSTRVNSDLT